MFSWPKWIKVRLETWKNHRYLNKHGQNDHWFTISCLNKKHETLKVPGQRPVCPHWKTNLGFPYENHWMAGTEQKSPNRKGKSYEPKHLHDVRFHVLIFQGVVGHTLQGTRKHIPPKGKRKSLDSKVPFGICDRSQEGFFYPHITLFSYFILNKSPKQPGFLHKAISFQFLLWRFSGWFTSTRLRASTSLAG